MDEPKEKTQVVEEKSDDEKMDEAYDNFEREKETPGESSPPEETKEESEDAGADQPKEGESKEESKDPRDLMFRKGYNEAKEKFSKAAMSDEDRKLLAEVKDITSSSDYIQTRMKSQGYTQDAIDSALREKGFNVPERPGDDVSLVAGKLGLDTKTLDENTRATIGDVSKITRVIIQDALAKALPSQIKPLAEGLEQITQRTEGDKLVQSMKQTIKDEGVLDYTKDIEPELNKWLDANPQGTQADLAKHFGEVNHKLSIERLRGKKRKEGRDAKKGVLRQNQEGAKTGTMPTKTGDFDEDADAFLDSINYRE